MGIYRIAYDVEKPLETLSEQRAKNYVEIW